MRVYDLLLHLFPASFRQEYGDEMRALFRRRLRDAAGPTARAGLWSSTIVEIATNAALVHWDILRADLTFAGRAVIRTPGFALTAVLMVALGIGATTAAFSVTDFVLIRPLPFPHPERLVKIWETTPGYARMELSAPNYRDWVGASHAFESTGMYHFEELTLTDAGEPRRLTGTSVSASLFPTLGVSPLLGRNFTAEDDTTGAPATVILGYQLWQTEFGGDPGAIGRTVALDNEKHTIVGVMARDFHFPLADSEFWVPTRFGPLNYTDEERTNNWLEAVGRLRPGVSQREALGELQTIAARSRDAYPKENKDTGATLVQLGQEVSESSRLLLLALSGASACVLLIACANLANLLLARALGRRRELAVRAAIGAGQERLIRQLMTESLVLAAAGGTMGVLFALAAVPMLAQLVPATLPIAATPQVDLRVLAFALAATLATGVAFGLAPMVRLKSTPDVDGLREGVRSGGGRKERLRSALVVLEIVASIVLLVSAGLLIRALLAVQATDPGFTPAHVYTARIELPTKEYRTVTTRQAFYTRVLQDVRSLPGVTAAGFVSFLPMSSFRGGIWPVAVPGDTEAADAIRSANNVAAIRFVTPQFFRALGIPLLRGRDVEEGDSQQRPYVAVVSESFARRYWPGQDPIGRRFTFGFADREVVGVVGDVKFRGLERTSEPQVYLSSQQVGDGSITYYVPRALAVRTAGDPARLAPLVRAIVRRADPRLPITEEQTLTDLVERETVSRSVQVRVLSAFAAIAFLLAAIGIHGLLSFAVSQRAQEIGVRIALGARRADILGMIVWRSIALAAAGLVPGAMLAYAAARSMQALLVGVTPADGLTYAAAIGLTLVMTLVGTLAPAIRAISVDPITALRAE